jgi:hypothetical protein
LVGDGRHRRDADGCSRAEHFVRADQIVDGDEALLDLLDSEHRS